MSSVLNNVVGSVVYDIGFGSGTLINAILPSLNREQFKYIPLMQAAHSMMDKHGNSFRVNAAGSVIMSGASVIYFNSDSSVSSHSSHNYEIDTGKSFTITAKEENFLISEGETFIFSAQSITLQSGKAKIVLSNDGKITIRGTKFDLETEEEVKINSKIIDIN